MSAVRKLRSLRPVEIRRGSPNSWAALTSVASHPRHLRFGTISGRAVAMASCAARGAHRYGCRRRRRTSSAVTDPPHRSPRTPAWPNPDAGRVLSLIGSTLRRTARLRISAAAMASKGLIGGPHPNRSLPILAPTPNRSRRRDRWSGSSRPIGIADRRGVTKLWAARAGSSMNRTV